MKHHNTNPATRPLTARTPGARPPAFAVAVAVALATASMSCAPPEDPPEGSSDVETKKGAETVVVPSDTRVDVTIKVSNASQWDSFSSDLDSVIGPFRSVGGYVGAAIAVIDGAKMVLRFFGLIPTPADPFTTLSNEFVAIGGGLSWQISAQTINNNLQALPTALDNIASFPVLGLTYTASDPSYSPTITALNILRSTSSTTGQITLNGPFGRVFIEAATNGGTDWKAAIPAVAGITRPVPNAQNLVYDWRAGLPALLQAIPERLLVMAAVDSNFRTDHAFDNPELNGLANALQMHYQQMFRGVVCGANAYTDHFVGSFGGSREIFGCNLGCADMNTGISATSHIGPPPLGKPNHDVSVSCASVAATADYKNTLAAARALVMKKMPFLDLEAAQDSLWLTMHQAPDLAELNQSIPLDSDPTLCVEVKDGSAAEDTPVWLGPCNSGPAQWWVYDRRTSTVKNPALNTCLAVDDRNRTTIVASPVTTPLPQLDSYSYPVLSRACNGSRSQQWTYTPQSKFLKNGLGADLILTTPTSDRTRLAHLPLTARTTMAWNQPPVLGTVWRAETTLRADSHALLVTAGEPASGGGLAVNGENAYFPTAFSGRILEAAVDGLSVGTLGEGQSEPWAVAIDATNVYWTNQTASGSIMKAPINGRTAPVALASGLNMPTAIAVNSSGVYFTTSPANTTGTVMKVGLNGGTPVTLASNQVGPSVLALDADSVYWSNWTTDGTGTIMKTSQAAGGAVVTLASGQASPYDVAVDGTSVYWVNAGGGQIMKIAKTGGTPVTVAQDQPGAINLSVDATSVYWVTNNRGGALKKVGLGGGTPTNLALGLDRPYLAVGDPTYVYFATNDQKVMKVAKSHNGIVAERPINCGVLEPTRGLLAMPAPDYFVQSCDGRFYLAMQGDGNLVLYQGTTPLWASNTVGSGAVAATVRADGSFAVLSATGATIWSTPTAGNPGAWVAVQNDGNLVVYSSAGVALWASNTCCR